MTDCITLTEAARTIPSHPAALRKTLNQFGLTERRSDGQRIIPADLVWFFKEMKRLSGYMYPFHVRTRDDLLAAMAKSRAAADVKPELEFAPEPASLAPQNITNHELVAA
jgi:hypothetical protein